MLPVPRRALRSVLTYILAPVLVLTLLFSYWSQPSSSSSSSTSSSSKDNYANTASGNLRGGWEGVKRAAGNVGEGLGLNYLGLGGGAGKDDDYDDDFSSVDDLLENPSGDVDTNGYQRRKGKQSTFSTPEVQNHTYLSNGLLVPNPLARHPIYDLIERGKREWRAKHDRQSANLDEAVLEYRRRYHRAPPKGFDKW